MRKNKFFLTIIALALAGCGGGGGASSAVGQAGGGSGSNGGTGGGNNGVLERSYVDSPVEGINYTCYDPSDDSEPSKSGITDKDGHFYVPQALKYGVCSFSIGNFGIEAQDIDTIKSTPVIYPGDVSVAQLYQTIDLDGNASNGINISAEERELIEKLAEENGWGNMSDTPLVSGGQQAEDFLANLATVINSKISGAKCHAVSEEDAKRHLDESKFGKPYALEGHSVELKSNIEGADYKDVRGSFSNKMTNFNYSIIPPGGKVTFRMAEVKVVEREYIVFDTVLDDLGFDYLHLVGTNGNTMTFEAYVGDQGPKKDEKVGEVTITITK
jgi:hypothetical protein